MNIRELINSRGPVSHTVAAILLLAGIAALAVETVGSRRTPADISTKAFFTTDDQAQGLAAMQALFVDDATKAPPFDHGGKPAYLAIVYVCNGGQTKWVSYLKRYTPQMRKRVQSAEDAAIAGGSKYAVPTTDFDLPGTEIKRPGPGPWIKSSDPRFNDTKAVIIPGGAGGDDLDIAVP